MTTLRWKRAGAVEGRDAGATAAQDVEGRDLAPRQQQTKEMILVTALRRTETDMGF